MGTFFTLGVAYRRFLKLQLRLPEQETFGKRNVAHALPAKPFSQHYFATHNKRAFNFILPVQSQGLDPPSRTQRDPAFASSTARRTQPLFCMLFSPPCQRFDITPCKRFILVFEAISCIAFRDCTEAALAPAPPQKKKRRENPAHRSLWRLPRSRPRHGRPLSEEACSVSATRGVCTTCRASPFRGHAQLAL